MTKQYLQQHQCKLSVTSYEDYYGNNLHPVVIDQYKLDGLPGLLLSPRARRDGDKFDACSTCTNSLRSAKYDNNIPPKQAIVNPRVVTTRGADGEEEMTEIKEEDLTGVLCSLLSPVHAFGYVFAYTCGAHKSVRGHYSFYEVNHGHVRGVMNYYYSTKANPQNIVYYVDV